MKASSVLALAGAALVSAQCDTSNIPTCARGPIDSAIASVCSSSTDYACACSKQEALTAAAAPGVVSACGADVALNQVLPAVTAFCSAVNSGQCGGSGGGSSSSSSSSAPSQAPSHSHGSEYPTATHPSPTKSAYPTTTPAPTKNGTNTPSGKPTTVVTAGAAIAGSIGTFGMMVLGALAAF